MGTFPKKSSTLAVFLAFFVSSLFAHSTPAATLKVNNDTRVFEDATLVKSVVLLADDKTETTLPLVSHGLRSKAIFGLVPVRVYVLQLLAAHPDKLVRTETGMLGSLQEAGPVQLRLTFLRNLPGDTISDSFKEGLEVNHLDPKKLSPELEQVLKAISEISKFKKGETFALTFAWNADKATLYMTDATQTKTVTGNAEFAEQLLSIWFGKTGDGKLEQLKKDLIKTVEPQPSAAPVTAPATATSSDTSKK